MIIQSAVRWRKTRTYPTACFKNNQVLWAGLYSDYLLFFFTGRLLMKVLKIYYLLIIRYKLKTTIEILIKKRSIKAARLLIRNRYCFGLWFKGCTYSDIVYSRHSWVWRLLLIPEHVPIFLFKLWLVLFCYIKYYLILR